MFIRSDRAPDLSDPVMVLMFGGSISVYTLLSLVCIKTMYTENRKMITPNETGKSHHEKVMSLNPVLIGVLLGTTIFLWQQAVKEA